jgi:hypothetical protein
MIEDFLHLPPESTTPVVHLELQISPPIFEKIRNGPNGILRGLGGKLIQEKKNRSQKSRDTVPLRHPTVPSLEAGVEPHGSHCPCRMWSGWTSWQAGVSTVLAFYTLDSMEQNNILLISFIYTVLLNSKSSQGYSSCIAYKQQFKTCPLK